MSRESLSRLAKTFFQNYISMIYMVVFHDHLLLVAGCYQDSLTEAHSSRVCSVVLEALRLRWPRKAVVRLLFEYARSLKTRAGAIESIWRAMYVCCWW